MEVCRDDATFNPEVRAGGQCSIDSTTPLAIVPKTLEQPAARLQCPRRPGDAAGQYSVSRSRRERSQGPITRLPEAADRTASDQNFPSPGSAGSDCAGRCSSHSEREGADGENTKIINAVIERDRVEARRDLGRVAVAAGALDRRMTSSPSAGTPLSVQRGGRAPGPGSSIPGSWTANNPWYEAMPGRGQRCGCAGNWASRPIAPTAAARRGTDQPLGGGDRGAGRLGEAGDERLADSRAGARQLHRCSAAGHKPRPIAPRSSTSARLVVVHSSMEKDTDPALQQDVDCAHQRPATAIAIWRAAGTLRSSRIARPPAEARAIALTACAL